MAQYTKLDDATIARRNTLKCVNNDHWMRETVISEIFNFNSRQIITITENICVNKPHGRSNISANTVIQNFNDIEDTRGIERAHAELLKLDGNPPPLDSTQPRRLHKPAVSG